MSANVMLLSVFWKYERKNLHIFVCKDEYMPAMNYKKY